MFDPAPFPRRFGRRVHNTGSLLLGLLLMHTAQGDSFWAFEASLGAFAGWVMLAQSLLIDRPTWLGRYFQGRFR